MYKNYIILLIVNHSLARGLQTIFLYLLFPKRIICSLEWKKSLPFCFTCLCTVHLFAIKFIPLQCNEINLSCTFQENAFSETVGNRLVRDASR